VKVAAKSEGRTDGAVEEYGREADDGGEREIRRGSVVEVEVVDSLRIVSIE